MFDSHSNIWHAPLYWAHLLCQGQSGCCGLAQGGGGVAGGGEGERASGERARWAQAGGASPTLAIRLVGLGSTLVHLCWRCPCSRDCKHIFVPGQNPVIKALCFDKYVHCELDPVLPWGVG